MLMVSILTMGIVEGCGATGKNTTGENSGQSATEEGKGNASEGAVNLELFSTKAENKETLQKLADKFHEQNPAVTVTITAPADAGTVLKTRMAKNDMPDLVAMGGDNNYKEVESAGMLEDLSSESYIADIQPAYLQMVYDVNKDKEEKAFGIPYATNASGILYNVDKFKDLGIEVPKTWDEFTAAIDKIEAAGEKPFLLTYKDAWTGLCAWNSMAPDLQPENFTDDRKAEKTTFASTHGEIAKKYLTILSHAQDDFMGTTYDDGNKAFANGEACMMINGNWAINQFKNANPKFNVDMFAFPASNDESKNYVTSGVDVLLGICTGSENKDAAKKFIAFMVEPEQAQAYIDDQFAISAVKGVEQKDDSVAGMKKDIASGKVANFPDHYYPAGFDLASLLSGFSLNYVNGMDDQKNIDQFLSQCDEKYDAANVD